MTRDIAITILLTSLLFFAVIAFREHRAQPLALVQADYPQGDAHLLVSPCPIAPRNFPTWRDRKA